MMHLPEHNAAAQPYYMYCIACGTVLHHKCSQARDCEPVRQSSPRLLQTLVAQECCRDCDHPKLVMHTVQPGTQPEEEDWLHLKPSNELWICETPTALCCHLPHSPARADIRRNLDLTRSARLSGLLSCSPPLYESCRSTEEEVCWVAFPLQHHTTVKLTAYHLRVLVAHICIMLQH